MKEQNAGISVALLMQDIGLAREISTLFRKTGTIPHVYETLEDYWMGVISDPPTFSVVDVQMMSDGERSLRNHPRIKEDSFPIAFYYQDEYTPLVVSTYDIFHMGLILGPESLEGQLKNILKRLNHFIDLKSNNQVLDQENKRISSRFENVYKTHQTLREDNFYVSELKRFCQRLDEAAETADSIFKVCEDVFHSENLIGAYSFLTLSQSGQKLVAPPSQGPKYKKIPSLWLGKVCPQGIETFAQNMSNQVAIDLLEGELVSLFIRGQWALPEAILYLKVPNTDFLNRFDWNFLEKHLSGIHASLSSAVLTSKRFNETVVSPWEFLSSVDQNWVDRVEATRDEDIKFVGKTLVTLDCMDITELIRSTPEARFFWGRFYGDFLKRLFDVVRIDFKVASFGVNNLAFLVSSSDGGAFFQALSDFSKRFSYWRYFEDVDTVLSKNFIPKVKMIPCSSEAFLNFVEVQFMGNQKVNQKGKQELLPRLESKIRPRLLSASSPTSTV